ncbi:hypothetical protein TELCIR_17057, partial [Teladorsagia circumcincta]
AGSVGASISIWILCGVWSGIGAYIYVELGVLITKSGADYAYLMEAFGPAIGFIRLWIESMVIRPVAVTIKALTFALYVVRPFYPDCEPPDGTVELLAITMIMVLCAINCYSMTAVKKLQDWFTVAKLLALLTVFANKVYGKLSFLMSLFVAVSTFGSANGNIMMSSRLFYCGAREGQMPTFLAMTNKRLRTPLPATIFLCFMSALYLLLSSNVFVLINASQTTVWVSYIFAALALLVLRYKMPDADRPVKHSALKAFSIYRKASPIPTAMSNG